MKYIHCKPNRYFAAANTAEGFKSKFDAVFNKKDCEKLYILKGGPGVGKSTFMKKAACFCEGMGMTVEYFHCSSDPDSLDGIFVKEKKIAIADGTIPHAVEATLAGAYEEIIDLGKAWDTDCLFCKRKELQRLSDAKKACFNDAYDTLGACKKIKDILKKQCLPFVNTQKLESSVQRLAKGIIAKNKSENGRTDVRLTCANSCKGKVRFDSFEEGAHMCIFVKDSIKEGNISELYLNSLYEKAKKMGTDMLVSFSPLDLSVVDGLFFVNEKVSVTRFCDEFVEKCDKSGKKCRIVNTSRFFNNKEAACSRKERKFYEKLAEALENKALDSLAEAGRLHFTLENLYSKCTDYSKVEKMQSDFMKKLSKNQKPRQ